MTNNEKSDERLSLISKRFKKAKENGQKPVKAWTGLSTTRTRRELDPQLRGIGEYLAKYASPPKRRWELTVLINKCLNTARSEIVDIYNETGREFFYPTGNTLEKEMQFKNQYIDIFRRLKDQLPIEQRTAMDIDNLVKEVEYWHNHPEREKFLRESNEDQEKVQSTIQDSE